MQTLRLGHGTLGSPGFVHPDSPWMDSGPGVDHPTSQDLDAARGLLDDLGFVDVMGDGFREDLDGNTFTQTILVYAERPERVRAAEIMAEWFEEIGLRTEVKAMEAATVDSLVWPEFDVTQGRNFDLAIWGWSAGIQENPLSLRELFHTDGTLNVGAFSHREMDLLSDQILGARALEDIPPIVSGMSRIVADKLPFITLWYPDSVYGFRPEAHDGWTFVVGVGVLDKLSLITERGQSLPADNGGAAPVAGEADEQTAALWPWIAGLAAVVGAYFLYRRR